MKKILATVALAALALSSTPAAAASPSAQANATAKIFKPLQISKATDLDFGTIVLVGAAFAGETVTVATDSSVTCGSGGGNLTCSGAPTAAKFHLVGTNNAMVTVNSPSFNLGGPSTLAVTPTSTTQSVSLGATGLTTGVDVFLGGSITLASSTPDGVYTGIWTVTADYQ
jgi:Mat/Ecp fimbriae major subunit